MFVFLKFFGENRYDLPKYYEHDYPATTGCEEMGLALVSKYVHIQERSALIFWEPLCEGKRDFYAGQVERIKANLDDEFDVQIIIVTDSISESEKKKIALCGLLIAEQTEENLQQWECDGFMVLVDKERIIRGYYSGSDFEDIDRLILEMQILKAQSEL